MDLDDSFCERALQNIQARREYIKMQRNTAKRAALEELEVNSDDPPEESPKRQCTEATHSKYTTDDKENFGDEDEDASTGFVPYHSASKNRGLAALKRNFHDGDNDSAATPIHQEPSDIPKVPMTAVSESSKEVAQRNPNPDQNSDDDEYSDAESIDNEDFAENYGDFKLDDPSRMEVDEYTTKQSNVPLKLNEENSTRKFAELKPARVENSLNTSVDPSELPLSARKALFEKALLSGSPKVNDDVPVHTLSVTQRAAMFESASKGSTGARSAANLKEAKRIVTPDIFNLEKKNDSTKSPVKVKQPVVRASSQETTASPVKKLPSTSAPLTPSPSKNVGNHTRFIQQKLIESTGSSWQEKQTAKAAEERKKEISSLVNHWEKKISSSSSAENNSEKQKVSLASDENFSCKSEKEEDIQESVYEESEYSDLNNDGISEHEVDLKDEYSADEEDYDEEDSNRVDTAEDTNCVDTAEDTNCVDTNEDSDKDDENVFYSQEETENLAKSLNEYCESKQHDSATTSSDNNSKSIMSCISYSDILACTGDSPIYSSISLTSDSSAVSDASDKKEKKNPEINLLRTVSAYRREKQELKVTPVRKIVLNDEVSSPESPPDIDYTEIIQQRLKDLQEEILRQQTVISQTSQALNLCSATTEFSGSIEQVEGERLLLIATQKRQACLNEITRLKTCGAQGMRIDDGTGTLTVTDLQLPLKREFIASQVQGRDNDFVHYFLCLIRHGAQVIVTQMMSTDEKTSDGTLSFSNLIKLTNLPADFSVVFEVYALQTKKDVLPHDKKYHIKRENSKRRLTPKTKRKDNKSPAISSPGGPSAVRSPSFGIVGYTRFTIQNCNKKTFTLDKVPFTSPLEGVLRVKLQLHAEQKVYLKGCLNFYEDIGDQGALTLRWCVLDGSRIAYWRNNPEDIYKKDPVGVIDLRHCVTDVVKSVSTTECLRPHTFKLITMRPYQKGDRNTLVSRTDHTMTTRKYLLTAVSKEERILWCNKINEALTNLRKWDPEALQPMQHNIEI